MPFGLLALVGLSQIVGIGTLFYAYAVLAGAMSRELGYSQSWLFGALTISIFIGAAFSPLIGRLIDRHGAYRIVVAGSLLAVVSLVATGLSTGMVSLTMALVLVQIASNMTLYEAVFPALVQIDEKRARKLVAEITLFGGFASTVSWPVTQFSLDAIGWRETWFAFAAINLLFCTPVYAFALRGARAVPALPRSAASGEHPVGQQRTMLLLTIMFCLASFSYQAINYGLVPALVAHGMAPSDVALIGALLGPSSVIARVIDIRFAARVSPLRSATFTILLLCAALIIPIVVFDGSYVGLTLFVVLFGVSQGIFAILRGTLPLELFGSRNYGLRLGAINAARRYTIAACPFLFVFGMETLGVRGAFAALALIAIASYGALHLIPRN